IHAPSDMGWAVERVGWERLKGGSYAARSLIDSGATVVLGSDFPIESASPWWGIHAAVSRQNAHGEPPQGFLPEQKLTLEQALERYCVTPHRVIGDGQPGLLRPGAPADFVVVAGDPFSATPSELHDVAVLRTVVAGREIFSSPPP
ncbi:MAG TPA: amidohydrolase family protein, partial [Myxococcota bacterium]|nr:amidohydrolase family protein [Myxococcota bacterium]